MLLLKELLIPHRRIFQTAILYVFARLILPILAVLISPLGQGIHFISYVLSAPFLPVRLLSATFLSLWSTPEGVVTHDGGLYDLVLFGQVVLDLLILYILCGGIVYLYEKQKKALLYTSVVLFVVLPLVCQLFFILALHCSPSVDNPAKPLIAEVPRSTLVRYAELREISALSTLTIQKCKRFTDGYLRYAISTTTERWGAEYIYENEGQGTSYRNYKDANLEEYSCEQIDMDKFQYPASLVLPDAVKREFEVRSDALETTLSFCVKGGSSIFTISRGFGFSGTSKIYSAKGLLLNESSDDDVGYGETSWGLRVADYKCDTLQSVQGQRVDPPSP